MTGQVYSSLAQAAAMLWGSISRPRRVVPVQVTSDLRNENFVVLVILLTSNYPQLKWGTLVIEVRMERVKTIPTSAQAVRGKNNFTLRYPHYLVPLLSLVSMRQTYNSNTLWEISLQSCPLGRIHLGDRLHSHGLLWSLSCTLVMASRRNPEAKPLANRKYVLLFDFLTLLVPWLWLEFQ